MPSNSSVTVGGAISIMAPLRVFVVCVGVFRPPERLILCILLRLLDCSSDLLINCGKLPYGDMAKENRQLGTEEGKRGKKNILRKKCNEWMEFSRLEVRRKRDDQIRRLSGKMDNIVDLAPHF